MLLPSAMKLLDILLLCALSLVLLISPAYAASEGNLVLNKPVTTSFAPDTNPGSYAVDDVAATYWRAGVPEGEVWLAVDLGHAMPFNRYALDTYGYPYMSGFKIQYSDDGVNWHDAMEKIDTLRRNEEGSFPTVTARYVRYLALRNDVRSSAVGLRSFELFYDGKPVLGQLSVPEVGFTVASPVMDVYDVIVPAGITQVTLTATPMVSSQRVQMAGQQINQVQVALGARAEYAVPITVTAANGQSNQVVVTLKRLPTHSDYYQLTYEDHFTGDTLNQADWFYRTSSKWDSFNLPGNVWVGTDAEGNSNMNIDFKQADYNGDGKLEYSGGGIVSRNAFGYGYYEVRAKLYGGTPGFHQSFWTMGQSPQQDVYTGLAPKMNALLEIDGFEVESLNPGRLNVTIHRYYPELYSYPGRARFELDTTNWFVWGFEWLPNRVNFYANGEYLYTYHTEDIFAAQNVLLSALADGRNYTQAPLPDAKAQFDYFRFYARTDAELNYVGNASFEFNDGGEALGWIKQDNTAASTIVAKGRTGEHALEHSYTKPYKATTKQRLTYIPNGTYQVSAWVQSSGNQTEAKLQVSNHGGDPLEVTIAPGEQWQQVVIDQVAVTENYMEVAIISASDSQTPVWLCVDDVAVMRR